PLAFYLSCFNRSAPTDIYTLSLHDALPISCSATLPLPNCQRTSTGQRPIIPSNNPPDASGLPADRESMHIAPTRRAQGAATLTQDRKSTRLNSSHSQISYAVFCLKKKKSAL